MTDQIEHQQCELHGSAKENQGGHIDDEILPGVDVWALGLCETGRRNLAQQLFRKALKGVPPPAGCESSRLRVQRGILAVLASGECANK